MLSFYFFVAGTFLLSLNFTRIQGFPVSDWMFLGSFISVFFETLLQDRKLFLGWVKNPLNIPVFVVLIGSILSTANSQFPKIAIFETLQFIYVTTIFISLIWIMVKRGRGYPVIVAFVCSGVLTASVAVWDYLTGDTLGLILSHTAESFRFIQEVGRYIGTLGHPNKLGYFLVITVALSYGILMSKQPGRWSTFASRVAWMLALLIQVAGIYLSGSLTAIFGLVAVMAVFLLSSRVVLNRSVTLVAPIILLGLCVVLLRQIPGMWSFSDAPLFKENAVTVALRRVQNTTAGLRVDTYKQALERINENPFVGVGNDQLSTSSLSSADREFEEAVHNPLLQAWYTSGIIGFMGWVMIIVVLGWVAIRVILRAREAGYFPEHIALAAAVVAALLMSQTQSAIYQREHWLVIGLLVTYSSIPISQIKQHRLG